jgi:drug/metabolite transporter (DMT)-like permease
MTSVSLVVGTTLRAIVGLIAMTIIVAVRGKLHVAALWPAGAGTDTLVALLLMSVAAGSIPLVFYYWGLKHTRASTGGFMEMTQTLSGVAVSGLVLGATLAPHQLVAAAVLLVAIALLQRAQAQLSSV